MPRRRAVLAASASGSEQFAVALTPIDGETITDGGASQSNFTGAGYYTRKGFTYAANWTGPSPIGGTFDGFDDPTFFPIGLWAPDFTGTSFYTRMQDLALTVVMPAFENVDLDDLETFGFPAFVEGNRFPSGTITSGQDPSVVGSINGEEPFDDATVENIAALNAAWLAGADGPGRFVWNNYADHILNGSAGSYTASELAHAADLITCDQYWFTGSCADPGDGQGLSQVKLRFRMYDYPEEPTYDQTVRGSHYGSMVDAVRKHWAAADTRPMGMFVENGAPYELAVYQAITPTQMVWALWSTLVHGARALNYFNHTFRVGDAGYGFNNFNNNYYGGPGVAGTGIYAAAKNFNEKALELAPVLNSPVDGYFAYGDRNIRRITEPGFLTAVTSTNPRGPYSGVDASCRWQPDDEKHYILATCREEESAEDVPVTFEMSDQGQTAAVELFSSRTLSISRGGAIPAGFCEFSDTFTTAGTPLCYRIDGGTGATGGTRPGEYQLFEETIGPATSGNDASPISMGLEFSVSTPGASVTTLWYWRATVDMGVGVVQGQVFQVSGAVALGGGPVTFPAPTGLGWQSVTLPTPVALTSGAAYKAVVYFADGEYCSTSNYWSSGDGSEGRSHPPLFAPATADAVGGGQCTFTAGSGLTYPTSTSSGGNYWLDVTVTRPTG